VHDVESNRTVDPDIELLIEREWQRQLERAAARGATYYDSETYRLNDFAEEGNSIVLYLAPAAYRIHAAMKAIHDDPRIAEEHFDRQIVVDSIVRTMDDYFVLHSVEKVVETETYLIGGSCSKSRTVIESASDLVVDLLNHVDRVLGLDESERAIGDLRGIVQNEIGCVHVIFDVRVTLTSNELWERFVPGPVSKAIEVVPQQDIQQWIADASGYMRVMSDLVM
jgi:hypothetical protein